MKLHFEYGATDAEVRQWLEGLDPEEAKAVWHLHLGQCVLHDDALELLERLSSLRTLTLPVGVTDETLRRVGRLKELEWLEIGRSLRFTAAGFAHLAPLERLKTIKAEASRVNDLALVEIAKLRGLKNLDLSRCAVTDEGLAALGAKPEGLKTLDLSATRITDAGLRYITPVRLTKLDLGFVIKLTDAGLSVVAGFRRLEELVLHGTEISDSGLPALRSLKRLKTLKVGFTHVTSVGMQDLQQHLPQCFIVNA